MPSNLPVYDVQELHFDDDDEFFTGTLDNTFATRIPHRAVRAEFRSGRSTDLSLQSRLAHSRPGYQMPRSEGAIEIDVPFCGAQVDTATGALAATGLSKLIGDGLGGTDLTAVGGVAGADATASALTNATGTRVRGHIVRVGEKRDGRADGQAAVIGDPDTALLTALPAAPSATDVIRACIMLYFSETLGAAKRFLLGWAETGEQYAFHGCQLERMTIGIAHGDVHSLSLRYPYAWWDRVDGITIPSALTQESCDDAIAAAGSYFLQTVGTATRNLAEASEIEITLNTGLVPHRGQGGIDRLQTVTGWTRTKAGGPGEPYGTLRLTVPKEQAMEAEYDADGSDSILKHLLATLSVGEGTAETEGRHVALYAPSAYYIGQRPSPRNLNGLVYQDVFFGLREGPDETNELTRSILRIGLS